MLFVGLLVPIYLASTGLGHPPFFTLHTYRGLRKAGSLTPAPLDQNRPLYDSLLLEYKEVLGIELHQIIFHPLVGFLITLALFLLALKILQAYHLAGFVTLLLNVSVNRGLWSYTIRRLGIVIFLFLILSLWAYSRDNTPRLSAVIMVLFISLNLTYYTAGGWGVVLLGAFLGINVYVQFRQGPFTLNRLYAVVVSQRGLGILVAFGCFFLYFTRPLYVGVPALLASVSITDMFTLQGLFSVADRSPIFHTNSYQGPIVQAKLVYLVILMSTTAVYLSNRLQKSHFGRDLNRRDILFLSLLSVAAAEFSMYLLLGTLIPRLFVLFIPIFIPYLVLRVRGDVSFLVPNDSAIIVLSILLMLGAGIFAMSVQSGQLNNAATDQDRLTNAGEMLGAYTSNAKVTGDLYLISFLPLGQQFQYDAVSKQEYRQIVLGNMSGKNHYYVFHRIDSPVKPARWDAFKPYACAMDEPGERFSSVYDNGNTVVVDLSLSKVSYDGSVSKLLSNCE